MDPSPSDLWTIAVLVLPVLVVFAVHKVRACRIEVERFLAPPNRIGPDHPRLTESEILALGNPSLIELCRLLQSMDYQGYQKMDLPPDYSTFEAIVREYVDRTG